MTKTSEAIQRYTEKRIRELAPEAAQYRNGKIQKHEEDIERLQRELQIARGALESWEKMDVNATVALEIHQASSGASHYSQIQIKRDAFSRANALFQAERRGKGILPAGSDKGMTYIALGALMFALASGGTASLIFHIHSHFILLLICASGMALGGYAGYAFFESHFVIDESWMPPLMHRDRDSYINDELERRGIRATPKPKERV